MRKKRYRQLMSAQSFVPSTSPAVLSRETLLLPTSPAELPQGTLLCPTIPAGGLTPVAPPATSGGAVLSLRDGLTVLFCHKFKSIAFLAATVTATWFFTAHEKPLFTSEAMLLVRQGRENVSLDPTSTTGEMSPVRQEWDQTMNSEVSILRSRELTEELVDKLGAALLAEGMPDGRSSTNAWHLRARLRQLVPGFDAAPKSRHQESLRNTAIKKLGEAIKVEAVDRSGVINIACTLGNPTIAQRVVRELISLYSSRHVAAYSRPGSLEFFQAQTADCRQRLQRADDALRRAKNEMSIASLQIEREAIAKRIADLRTQKETLDDRVVTARVQYTALDKKLETDTASGPMPSPEAFRVRRQALQTADLACKSLQQEVMSTESHLSAALAVLKTLNDNESTVHDLQRERDLLEADYVKYVARLEEARISVALEKEKISNVNVIQSPTCPIEPNPTHSLLLRILSLLLGLGGGLGVAFVSESMDDTVRRPQDLDRGSIRALASLPRLKRRQIGLRLQRPSGAPVPGNQICHQPPEAARHFEALVYRALLAMKDRAPHPTLIGVTSCYPGEGVTTITRHLAVSLAGTGGLAQRSMLVEPNAQQLSWLPFLGRNLGPRATEFNCDAHGDVAVSEHSIFKRNANEQTTPADGEMPDQELIRRARACNARFVIFDLPPLSDGVTAERMAGWMDHVILVVECERVRWPIVAHAQRRLAEARVALLGAVLNKRRYHIPAWLYSRL